MNIEQAKRIRDGKGFLAALDQSGGSTPKALEAYGIPRDFYSGEQKMFDLVHQMRTRVISSPAFNSEHILGAILFEQTMERTVDGMPTGDYLWEKKGIVPFLKVDKGLAPLEDGVQMMKPIDGLDELLKLQGIYSGQKCAPLSEAQILPAYGKSSTSNSSMVYESQRLGLCPSLSRRLTFSAPTKWIRRRFSSWKFFGIWTNFRKASK